MLIGASKITLVGLKVTKNIKGVMEFNGSYQDRIQEGSERTMFWIDVQRKTDIAEVEEVKEW